MQRACYKTELEARFSLRHFGVIQKDVQDWPNLFIDEV